MAKILVVALVAATVARALSPEEGLKMFLEWSRQHEKGYATGEQHDEFMYRLQVFLHNYDRMRKIQREDPGAEYGMTEFADMTEEEFAERYLSSMPVVYDESRPRLTEIPRANDDSVDWREQGAVTPVKNQGSCGSCWAFSAVGNMESRWFLAGHDLVQLSEQNLVDCDHECSEYEGEQACDEGCNGGLMWNGFEWVRKNGGIMSEDDYPYAGYDGQCSFDQSKTVASFSNWTMLSQDEGDIANYVAANGPVSVALNANNLQFYIGGVSDPLLCSPKHINHGVLIVGYGSEHKDFWIVKNSWGSSWGEKGYFRMRRGKGTCGINLYACSAEV